MSSANGFWRMLAVAAIPLPLAGCDAGSTNSAQGSAAAANETVRQTTARSTPTRTGYADVEGGRIYNQVYGDPSWGKTPIFSAASKGGHRCVR